ncbi:MAG: methyl-accepting chemotaxis protein [Firmicutes bacterium]|nr:methyl-accepting chemotaxis protein [Bacillota bacterium]
MRNNQPVTQHEKHVQDGAFIVSTTDLKGHITYANEEFIRLSGFTREELIGQPHNLVRHPDMPSVAFADLWATVQKGKPWFGIVKNRSKDGGFYWVDANVTPVVEEGRVIGYVSIRSKPSRTQIRNTELLYAAFRAGKSPAEALRQPWIPLAEVPFNTQLTVSMSLTLVAFIALIVAHLTAFPSTTFLVGGAVTLALLLGGMAYHLRRTLQAQIGGDVLFASEVVRRMAQGDMRTEIPLRPHDRTSLLATLLGMQSNLKGMVNRVRFDAGRISESAETFVESTHQVSTTSHELARNAEDQQVSVDHMATAMVKLSASIDEVSQQVRVSERQAEEAVQATREGDRSGAAAMAAMEQVEEATTKVVGAVRMIQDIARQTNLLSLNAGIEAARAGALGKGFAVVADEIRKLAERSAQSASEIALLIQASDQAVAQGKHTVHEAVDALETIREHISQVTAIAQGIRGAAEEQLHASTEVSHQVDLNARKAGENASASLQLSDTVDRNAATSRELARISGGLLDLLKDFKS